MAGVTQPPLVPADNGGMMMMQSLLFALAFTHSGRLVAELAWHLEAGYRPPACA